MPRRKPERTLPVRPEQLVVACWNSTWSGCRRRTYSEDTVSTRRSTIGYFLDWCQERGLENPLEITRPMLERYQRSFYPAPQEERPAADLPHAEQRLRSLKGLVPVAGAAELSPAQPGLAS